MEFVYQMLWVVLVLGLLVFIVRMWSRKRVDWWSRWRRPGNGKPEIELIDRLSLTPQHSVHLLRVGSRTVLVSCQPGGTTLLSTLESNQVPPSGVIQ